MVPNGIRTGLYVEASKYYYALFHVISRVSEIYHTRLSGFASRHSSLSMLEASLSQMRRIAHFSVAGIVFTSYNFLTWAVLVS